MLCAPVTTLTELSIVTNGGGIMTLAGIGLPFLHNLTLSIQPEKRGFQGEHSCVHYCAKDGQEALFEGKFSSLPPGSLPIS